MRIRKAIVLAAGLGTRLRPFTCVTPKPLMPVWGEPMLARIVSMLRGWGVTDFAVNSHCLHEQVEAWADEYRRSSEATGDGIGITVSYEPEILGTGGVLNPLRDWIGNEPFYLVNGDIVVENAPDPAGGSGVFDSPDVIGCGVVSESGPQTLEVEPESGFVTNWASDDAGIDGTFTYCGIAALKPAILDYVRPDGFSTIVEAYDKAMMDGKFIKAVGSDEMLWTDAGTVASYVELNRDGEDNAFSDFPQVRAALDAVGSSGPVTFLGARGSERVFFRCDKGIVILYDDEKRTENGLYAGHARFLRANGMPVPEVLSDLPQFKTMVLDYAGEERKMSLEDDVKVIETMAKFNALADVPGCRDLPMMPAFDAAVWKWERELFETHCLGTRFHREMPPKVREELENVASLLECEPKALVHRDFQSTNVLWKNGELSIIDFQGMRFGPAAYDLASFVYDPYVKFTVGERRALVKLYAKRCGRDEIIKIVPFAAVERLVQCLGAYGRLASVGQPQFGRWVESALENLLEAADEAGLDAIGALAEDLIAAEGQQSAKHSHSCSCGGHGGHSCSCGEHS